MWARGNGASRQLRLVTIAGALLASTLAGVAPARADCGDPFRDPDDVLDFYLQTTSATWAAFQSSMISGEDCDDQYPYFAAQFRCGQDEPPIAIGFRRKRDRSETRAKLPIKLDFNREVPGQRWPAARGPLGFRKLSLNSGMADDAGRTGGPGSTPNPGTLSAMLTEHLAWRLMREELPEVSGVAYARLTVELSDTGATEYQGLYVLIEDIDRTAVKARFGSDGDDGTLLKTTDLACVDQVEYDDGPPNAATDLFAAWLAEAPVSFPGGWYARTDQAIHLDSLLRQEALRELLANTGDTVLGNRNNYLSLDLRTDRRWYFPWDLDDMFRPFPQVRAPETPLVHACSGGPGCSTPNRVGQNIRDNPEIRPRYLEIMCQLSNGVAEETKLIESLLALDALVRPIIAVEVEPVWAPLGRDPLNAAVAGTYAAEVERLKTWIPARIEAVRAMIRAEGVVCERGCLDDAVEDCEYRGHASRRVCAGGRWGSCETPTGAGGAGGADGLGGAAGAAGAGGATPAENGGAGGTPVAPDPPATKCSSSGCSCALAVDGGDRLGRRDGDGPLRAVPLVWLLLALVARPARRPVGRRDPP